MSEHTTRTLAAMPAEKAAAKKARTLLGAGVAIFGALACLGSFVALVMLITSGATLDKWAAGVVGLFFVGGLAMFGVGAHVMSGELVGAAMRDVAAAVRAVWRRNGNGGHGGGS